MEHSNSVQIYSVALERLDKDPDDPEERAESEPSPDRAGEAGAEGAPPRRGPAERRQPPREIKMDWAGLKRRTRQITRMPFPIFSYTLAPDSRTIVFVTSEPAGPASVPVIYSVQDDGKRLTRITTGQPPSEEGGPGGGGGFGGGISTLLVSRDGRTLFFNERDGIFQCRFRSLLRSEAAAGAASAASRR